MKRIVIFASAYLPWQGGAELAIKEITKRVPEYEFHLICAKLGQKLPKVEKIGRVTVHRLGIGHEIDKLLLPFLGFLCAIKLHKNKRVNLIWGIMASWGSIAGLFFKSFYSDIPFLLTLQEGDNEEHIKKGRLGLINLIWRLLLKKADFLQVISNYLAEMARRFGYRREVKVVPNGVDVNNFQFSISNFQTKSNPEIKNLKTELGIEKNEKVIITVSRLVQKNGVADLIDAVWFLVSNCQLLLKILVIGDGVLRQKLEDKTKSLKLEDKVLFLGEVPNDEVPKYLAIADVFVRPSLSEGLGTAFLEAMAAGVPIIGTSVGGIPDFLKDRETGLLCEVNNPKSIAEKIKMILDDNGLRKKIIYNAKILIEEKYQWDKIAEEMKNIFNRLIFLHINK